MTEGDTVYLRAGGRYFHSELVLIIVAIVSGILVLTFAITGFGGIRAQIVVGFMFTLSLVGFIRLLLDPDSLAARQSNDILTLASQTLDAMKEGLDEESAQRICELLMPATPAIAVAITGTDRILGYAGYAQEWNPPGSDIRTTATYKTLQDGEARILYTRDEIGLPQTSARINAAIIQPLVVGHKIEGTLKFYYRKSSQISQTQISVARGFAELLSTQMAASALEEQTKLATSMELKALQAQINPHFLFNTINTIASLIRTDPTKARELLREFAVFYRSTLEDSNDLIALDRELKQVERYFSFETARFGEESLELVMDIDPEVREMLVPSFMVQPLVENCIRHGRTAERKLTIRVTGKIEGDNIVISVSDDGAGMTEERRANMMEAGSSTGLGIAVKNVRDRMRGYFGPDARMEVESELGKGTTVSFILPRRDVGNYVDTGTMEQVVV